MQLRLLGAKSSVAVHAERSCSPHACYGGLLALRVPGPAWRMRVQQCKLVWASPSPPPRPSCIVASAPPSSPAGPTKLVSVPIPQSQLEAVQHAVAAVKTQVQSSKAPKSSKTKKSGFVAKADVIENRFAVEIPSADVSPKGTAELATSFLSTLSATPNAMAPGTLTVVFADSVAAAAAAASRGGWRVLDLSAACREERLGGVLLLVAPQIADVALVEQLLDEVWSGPAAVVLNAEWSTSGVTLPAQYRNLADSFAVLYSFLPISVKGLVGNKEGAVLRCVKESGRSAITSTQWCILYETRGEFCQVGQTKARPKPEDLELAFSYASAATSPLTGMVRFLKSAADTVTGKRK